MIGLDWGTSSLRAWLFDSTGQTQEEKILPHGILNLPEGGFNAVLEKICTPWPDLPLIACGMIGSANGLRNVAYLPCPGSIAGLADKLEIHPTPRGPLHIVPGLMQRGAMPDVMRGEETQIAGVLAQHPGTTSHTTIVLPGTHSKWAIVKEGALTEFRTFMTGELYAVLSKHSILGRLSSTEPTTPDNRAAAFRQGVLSAKTGIPLSARLFSDRALVLAGNLAASCAPDYLSGLLIGDEIQAGIHLQPRETPPVIAGEDTLCEHYRTAFRILGYPEPELIGNTAAAGLFLIARKAGLVPDPRSEKGPLV
ncbi:2-dehydro-3-deoxygalactonokinase [Acetobacter oeni]|nr:2-dehydro-3-deoxygalactonokinase [Acetobacter oeni]